MQENDCPLLVFYLRYQKKNKIKMKPHLSVFVVQLPLKSLQQTLLFLHPLLILLLRTGGTPLWWERTRPPLLLLPQGGAHLQGLGLLRLQLDLELLEVPVESQALLLGPVR